MIEAAGTVEADIAAAFEQVDRRIAEGSAADTRLLDALRRRLVGELVFDSDVVAAELTPTFELLTYAAGRTTVTSRADMVTGIRRQGDAGGAVMWVEFDDLVVDQAVAGQGRIRTLLDAPAATARGHAGCEGEECCLVSFPFAFFVRFDGDLMASEILHMDSAALETLVVHGVSIPSRDRLLELVDRREP